MKNTFQFLVLIFSFLVFTVVLYAQSVSISKVPKQISIEFGYRNSFYKNTRLSNDGSTTGTLNNATNGYGFLVDYAWQLSGLNGKKPAVFLSVPIGYSVLLPDDALSKKISMLNYGWISGTDKGLRTYHEQ